MVAPARSPLVLSSPFSLAVALAAASLCACAGQAEAPPSAVAEVTAAAEPVADAPVRGLIADTEGVPVPGVRVRLLDSQVVGQPTELAVATSGADGRFALGTGHTGFARVEFKAALGHPVTFNLILEPGEAPLELAFTPGTFETAALAVSPADSLSGKLAAAHVRDIEHTAAVTKIIGDHQSPETAAQGHALAAEALAAYADAIEAEPDPIVRQAGAVYFFFIAGNIGRMLPGEVRARTREPALARWLLDNLEPMSPIWSVSMFGLAPQIADITGEPRRYDGALEAMTEHRDPAVAGAAWVHAARRRVAAGDRAGAEAIATRLGSAEWTGTHHAKEVAALLAKEQATGETRTVPAFEFPALAGGAPVSSSSLAGKPYLLDLWATWCGPCIVERERLHGAHKRYHERAGLEIVSISLDGSADDVARFREEHWPMPWRHAIGTSDASAQHIAALFGEDKTLPRMVLVGADGTIVAEADSLSLDNLDETLASALGS